MRIESSEIVGAPRERVFDVFADIEGAAERISGIRSLEILSDVKAGKGLRWRETRVVFGKEATEEMEITGFFRPSSYVVEAESNGTHYTSRFTFDAQGDSATRVTWSFEGKPLTFAARLMAPLGILFKGSIAKLLKQDVSDLKQFLET